MGVLITFINSIQESIVQNHHDYKILIIVSFIISTLSPLLFYFIKSNKTIKPLPSKLANNKNRSPGKWTPEDYKLPTPKPFEDWDIQNTKPIPYRAFKHKYNVTMGIRSMDPNEWIQLDNEWPKYHALKQKRFKEKGIDVYGTLPEAYNASMELILELSNYLSNRYPTLFQFKNGVLKNLYNDEEYNILKPDHDPIYIAANLLQDDIAIMIEQPDGQYYLKSGAIALAGFWRFKDKVNLPLSAIHTTGDVPKYNTHLKKGMEKFFTRLTPEAPVVRNNYFIQTDGELDWSSSIGDEKNENVGWYTAPKATDINQIYYRSERQSVRRLPISGAVVFTIRTYFVPMVDICKEPYVPIRLLDGINSWTEDVKEYRGYEKFIDVVKPYLEEKVKEQEAMGYTRENEVDKYPL
ncbi:hypothetical protein WICANDRAFT_33870 [Wickerhamomyces anomalus NRRL Y-366-8]|uniref:Uncharacterized protein n=1 Tax=Wickerhamomyces anomalus (strain ATCC 58044 / CBS 1984 / NCYC 433 / NRRL Y-366-8) TaxID=683960 RepID=A0A1E3NY93_WICAA|nr:uncharacterized protein WICANDRAFT_33870 [Wickerhamomyces anomalus NRRL Y-366-8]ODQ58128.1 hypothetical protein WICANDRAFT_33870 [Wickerhamomyces anomalus NRRL Y-366-8]